MPGLAKIVLYRPTLCCEICNRSSVNTLVNSIFTSELEIIVLVQGLTKAMVLF